MEKKNYNLEIFFESIKKSFCIFSKDNITFEEVKQKTIKEFKIPKEFEKDMTFTINIRNRPITLFNDFQILNNCEEMTKNYFYLKIFLNINNNNYIYDSSSNKKKLDIKIRPFTSNQFSIISNNKNSFNSKNIEKKYIEEIKYLKEELEKGSNDKGNKGDFDIRKFDEKYRDLCNKNNILEKKIFELENENKTLKIEIKNKKNNLDNISLENRINNNSIKEMELIISKLMEEHENNMIREFNGLKNTVDIMQKHQKIFYDKYGSVDKYNQVNLDYKDDKDDDNFELLRDDKKLKIDNNKFGKNEKNIINNDNFNILNNINNMNNSIIKRNINFYDEVDKNSKSFDISKNKNRDEGNQKNSLIKEIKNSFFENNRIINDMVIKKRSNNINIELNNDNNSNIEKINLKNQNNIFNYNKINKDILDEDLYNLESSSDIKSDIKKFQNKNESNIDKNNFITKEDKRKNGKNNLNNYEFNDKNNTPGGITERKDKNSFKKQDINITPSGK